MIVWGGTQNQNSLNDGGSYNPAGNGWTATSNIGTPVARSFHTAVWTGSEMIIFGGVGGAYLNDTFSYTPSRIMSLYQRP